MENNNDRWERDVLRKLLQSTLDEQRRARRWKIFFRLALLALIAGVLIAASFQPQGMQALGRHAEHTALVKLEGIILDGAPASGERIVRALEDAFENENSRGVVLHINSPGGSPVQSAQINDAIRRLRGEYPDKMIVAVAIDICASGAYYVAVAADEIYADAASLIGSIGVTASSFGFVEAIEKLGVERRTLKAGRFKDMLDPFLPRDEEAAAHLQAVIDEVHQQFIDRVREGRGARLGDDPDLFSGLVWSGEQAVALGLTDGIGDVRYVAREIIGAEEVVEYQPPETLLSAFSKRFGQQAAHTLLNHLATPTLH